MQMIIPLTRLRKHQRVLKSRQSFHFSKSVLETPAVLERVLGKCLSYDVTRALRYSTRLY